MTKLSDLRQQLRTGELEAKHAEHPDGGALRQYTIAMDGSDALIKFGKYKGQSLTQIVERDPAYMNFILENDFPRALKDVVRVVLARRDAGDMGKAVDELEAVFKGKLGDEEREKLWVSDTERLARKSGMTPAPAREYAEKIRDARKKR